MIIIEGSNRKSWHLANMLGHEYCKGKKLVVNTTPHTLSFMPDTVMLMQYCSSNEDMRQNITAEKAMSLFEGYEVIAFYTNDTKDELSWYLNLERTTGKRVIVTIQNNNMDDCHISMIV